ncbi:phospholipase A2 homolog 3 [Elaeis guineensis]|uniref:phospholipase A2 n=1 Tax=Elaeis guineensis var. tenera TaxID=51953 RepID=A0A6I9QWK3_ELAGV|nr:phospholipase A2 homolog 3 [Elaeis guineensis]
MEGGKRNQSLKLAILVFHPLLALLISTSPIHALNIGVQSANFGIISSKQQHCSRTCESQHCNTAPFLKYGKYCGFLYSGCPGEKPCDALDACCMNHDNCIQSKNNDYLNVECSENLLYCIAEVRGSGKGTFEGNKCMVEEVVDVITVVIEVALLAGRVLHRP